MFRRPRAPTISVSIGDCRRTREWKVRERDDQVRTTQLLRAALPAAGAVSPPRRVGRDGGDLDRRGDRLCGAAPGRPGVARRHSRRRRRGCVGDELRHAPAIGRARLAPVRAQGLAPSPRFELPSWRPAACQLTSATWAVTVGLCDDRLPRYLRSSGIAAQAAGSLYGRTRYSE